MDMLKGFLHISEIIIMIMLIFVMLYQFSTIPRMRMEWERPKLTLMSQDFLHVMDKSGVDWLDADDVETRFSAALPSTMGYSLTTRQDVRPVIRVGCVCNNTEFSVMEQEILTDFDLNGLRRRFVLQRIDPSNLKFSAETDVILFWKSPNIADLSPDDTSMRRYLSMGNGIVEFSDLDAATAGQQWHKDVFNLLWVNPAESSYVPTANARFPIITAPKMGYNVQKLFYHIPMELVPDPDMVGFYRFNLGRGTTAWDTSTHSNHGTLLDFDGTNYDGDNASRWVGGRYGKALEFDGVDDYVSIPFNPSQAFNNGMTVELWAKSNEDMGATERMDWVDRFSFFAIRNDERVKPSIGAPGPIFHANFSDGNMYGVGYLGNPPPATGEWHHYAGVFDSASRGLELWVDGVLNDTNNSVVGLTLSDTNNAITIGGDVTGMNFFNGTIDEVILYDRALTPGEIQLHYNRSMNRPKTFANFVSESVYPMDNSSDKVIVEQMSRYQGGAWGGRSVPLSTITWDVEGNGRTAWMSEGALTEARKQLIRSLVIWAANEKDYEIATEGDLKGSVKASLIKVMNSDMPEIIMIDLTLGFFF